MNRLHIVGHAGDSLAHRRQIEKPHRQALDVLKQLPAHFIDDALAYFLQQDLYPVGADTQRGEYTDIFYRRQQHSGKPLPHRLAGRIVPGNVQINGVSGDDGLVQLQSGQCQHQRQAHHHDLPMGLEVGEHPQHRVSLVVNVGQLLRLFVKQAHSAAPPSSLSCFSSCCLSWMLR